MSRTPPSWLIESAYVRLGTSSDGHTVGRAHRPWPGADGHDHSTELGYSARTATAWRSELEAPPLAAMPTQYLTPAIEDRVAEVQLLLADRGQHRAPSIPDLRIAAAGELSGLVSYTTTRTST